MASSASPPATISRKGRRARVLLSDSDSSPLGSPQAVAPSKSSSRHQPLSIPSLCSHGDCSPQPDQAPDDAAAMRSSGTGTPLAGISYRSCTAAPASSTEVVGHPAAIISATPCGVGFLPAIMHASASCSSSSMQVRGSGQTEQKVEEEEEEVPLTFQRSVRRAGARRPFLPTNGDDGSSQGGCSPAQKSSPLGAAALWPPRGLTASLAAKSYPIFATARPAAPTPIRPTPAAFDDDEEGSDMFFTPDGALPPDEASGEDAAGLPSLFDLHPGVIASSYLPENFLGCSPDAQLGGAEAPRRRSPPSARPSDTPAGCSGGAHVRLHPPADRLLDLLSGGTASSPRGGGRRAPSSAGLLARQLLISGGAISSASASSRGGSGGRPSSASSRGGSGGPLVFTRSVYRCAGRRCLLEDEEDKEGDEEGGSAAAAAAGASKGWQGGLAVALDFDAAEQLILTPSSTGIAEVLRGVTAGSGRTLDSSTAGRAEVLHLVMGGSGRQRQRVGGSSPRCSPSVGLNARPVPAVTAAAAAASLAAVAVRPTTYGIGDRQDVPALDVSREAPPLDVSREAPPFASDCIVISSDDEEGESVGEAMPSSSSRRDAAPASPLLSSRLPSAEVAETVALPPPHSSRSPQIRQIRGALELASLMNKQLSLSDAQPTARGEFRTAAAAVPEGGSWEEEEEEEVIDLAESSSSCSSDGHGPKDGADVGLDTRPPRGILSLLSTSSLPQGLSRDPTAAEAGGRGKVGVGGGKGPFGAPIIPPLVPNPAVRGGRPISAPKPTASPRIPAIASPDAK